MRLPLGAQAALSPDLLPPLVVFRNHVLFVVFPVALEAEFPHVLLPLRIAPIRSHIEFQKPSSKDALRRILGCSVRCDGAGGRGVWCVDHQPSCRSGGCGACPPVIGLHARLNIRYTRSPATGQTSGQPASLSSRADGCADCQ